MAETIQRVGRKLSFDDVVAIRARCANGEKQNAVAKDFGVSPSNVSSLVRGAIWAPPRERATRCVNGHEYTPENTFTNRRGRRECRACRRAGALAYVERNRDDAVWKSRQKRRRSSQRRFLAAVKTTAGCIDCGTRSGKLDFDHRQGTEKKFNLARPQDAGTWDALIEELEKCDVRCASCHAKRHWRVRKGEV